jgi:hypothetical protein
VLKLQWEKQDMHMGFWWKNLKERDHLEDLGVDGRKIFLFDFLELRHECMELICLAQDADQ